VAGSELVGSPLPLIPDPADLGSLAEQPFGGLASKQEPAGHVSLISHEGRS
jgi:hypothetical protein